jgi:hypothetical protein
MLSDAVRGRSLWNISVMWKIIFDRNANNKASECPPMENHLSCICLVCIQNRSIMCKDELYTGKEWAFEAMTNLYNGSAARWGIFFWEQALRKTPMHHK